MTNVYIYNIIFQDKSGTASKHQQVKTNPQLKLRMIDYGQPKNHSFVIGHIFSKYTICNIGHKALKNCPKNYNGSQFKIKCRFHMHTYPSLLCITNPNFVIAISLYNYRRVTYASFTLPHNMSKKIYPSSITFQDRVSRNSILYNSGIQYYFFLNWKLQRQQLNTEILL